MDNDLHLNLLTLLHKDADDILETTMKKNSTVNGMIRKWENARGFLS